MNARGVYIAKLENIPRHVRSESLRKRAALIWTLIAQLESDAVSNGDGLSADHLLEARQQVEKAIKLLRGA